MKSSPTKLSNSDICDIMYRDPMPTHRTCIACETEIKQSETRGYQNLISHLRKHPEYPDIVEQCLHKKTPVTMDMFLDKNAHSTHGWMKLVVMKNFPFAAVDDDVVRRAVVYDKMSSKTLKARMLATVEGIEPAIRAELKDQKFALVFDGLTDSCEHSLAVFAVTARGTRFLALSTFVNEASMTADEHIRFLDMIMNQYELQLEDLVAIVCDNCETNRAISRRIGVPMIGCASHRFNLAVKEHVKDQKVLIRKVSILMRKLRTVKRRALLKAHGCKYRPVPLHELRWSGLHRTFKRYSQLHPFLHLFERDREVDRDILPGVPEDDPRRLPIVDFIPSTSEHCDIEDLLEDMKAMEFATKKLQSTTMTVAGARDMFDEILEDFPLLRSKLGPDASIVQSPHFESAIVKLQTRRELTLTPEEKIALERMLRSEEVVPVTPRQSKQKKRASRTGVVTISVSKRRRTADEIKAALKKRREDREETQSAYEDLSWLPATSVVVERLFSTLKSTLGYLRKSMSADMLEALLYLRMNWDLATDPVISKAIRTARETDDDSESECESGGDEDDAEEDSDSDLDQGNY